MRNNMQTTIDLSPTVTSYEQTRPSWAKAIGSYAAVPAAYKDFFDPLLTEERVFPYTVLTPSFEGFLHRATEKLICDFGHEIYVLERKGDCFEAQCYPLEGISYVECRTILLDSRIKISGVTRQGASASSTLRFNTVTERLLIPIVERIRFATIGSRDPVEFSEFEKFDCWAGLNFKFMNYAKCSLLGGEKVIHTILQPEIRVIKLKILGMTFRKLISPTHMSVLTDRELIMIREEERRSGDNKYGGVWDYIPLNKITALSMKEKGNNLLALSVQLPEGAHLEYLFQASAKQEVNQLLEQFKELTAR